MNSKRMVRAGLCPARIFKSMNGIAAALGLAAIPVSALGVSPAAAAATTAVSATPAASAVTDFYRTRSNRPFWLSAPSGAAAHHLLQLLSSAGIDGLPADRYGTQRIAQALREAQSGKKKAVNRAELMLSEAFVTYARDLRRAPEIGVYYVDRELIPSVPSARALLEAAAAAPSLELYVRNLGWMNPMYGQLRNALTAGLYESDSQRQLLALNLERARTLPADRRRYVLVNSAAQRLYMYENGQVVDSMRVVVGKPKYPTPMMAAQIRYASLNPYWFVPPDLAAERIAPNAARRGLKYLNELGYEVLSDWTDDATMVDPATIDWKAVAEGKAEVRIRQRPGAHNSMGRMKFMFPNAAGVYLHDNPERELFSEASRLYSGGCVRLEDAARLGRWMFGRELVWEGAGTEEKVPLQTPVPVYITYLTAVPGSGTIAYFDDVYGRDASRLAAVSARQVAGQ